MPSYTTGSGSNNEILPDGSEWDFLVEDATEKESAAGNIMIELQLQLFDVNGQKIGPPIYDNIVFLPKVFWKLDQLRAATGDELVPGEQVTFDAEDAIDRRGRLVVTVDTYLGKTKNKVAHYVVPGESSTNSSPTVPAKARTAAKVGSGSKNEFGEPSDIPFRTGIYRQVKIWRGKRVSFSL